MTSEPTPPLLRRGLLRSGLAVALLGRGLLARAADPVVWLISADQSAAYADALAAVREALPGVNLRSFSGAALPPPGREAAPALVLTLGSSALQVALERAASDTALAQVPVAAGLLPRSSYERLPLRNSPPVTAVWLDPAVERHLDLLRLAMPERRRVAVLWGPTSRAWRATLLRAASERGLQLVEAELPGVELFPALSQVLSDADALLLLPDSAVYQPGNLNNVLIAAYRQRVPVLGYAATHVRAGATLALHTEPAQAGRQLAAVARRLLTDRRNLPPAAPSNQWTVGINDQVARSLGLSLPDPLLLTQALRRQEGRP